jgi:hypothetical protein
VAMDEPKRTELLDDLKPVVLGAISQRLTSSDVVPVNGMVAMTGSELNMSEWEKCDPGDPCYTKGI